MTRCTPAFRFGSDRAWYALEGKGEVTRPALYKGMTRTSEYLVMRDGVRIAIDLYLPEGLRGSSKLPTILMQTRYVRGMEYRSVLTHEVFQ